MSLFQDLKSIRAYFTGPEKWTRHVFARDNRGNAIDPRDPRACCCCLGGSVDKIIPPERQYQVLVALEKQAQRRVPGKTIPYFNDSATFEQVVEVIDDAISEAAQSS